MEREEALIEAVREYPCLYNTQTPNFTVQLRKKNAWMSVVSHRIDLVSCMIRNLECDLVIHCMPPISQLSSPCMHHGCAM